MIFAPPLVNFWANLVTHREAKDAELALPAMRSNLNSQMNKQLEQS